MTAPALRTVAAADVLRIRRDPLDDETLRRAAEIVDEVRAGGEAALRSYAELYDDLARDETLVYDRAALQKALDGVSRDERELLERTAARIRRFAEAQRGALRDLDVEIEGGRAGCRAHAMETAGCYAPGGRFPLPSTVLMTAVTARVAGVRSVWVASPRPAPLTLAAAAVAGADALLRVGGAQAIAALAFGVGPVPRCDAIVGPGNRWVTAAKQYVAGRVAIDMIAGPSELLVIADDSADPELIAADLLAQAEHDPDALPVLVTTSAPLVDAVNAALDRQLVDLPTADTARVSVANGFAVVVESIDDALQVSESLAPEHLEIFTRDAATVGARASCYGGLFVGQHSAEVLGDYGAGPNHTLPTSGAARFAGGLSVFNFLRVNTWLAMNNDASAQPVVADAVRLARCEGLEAHARAAERRSRK